MKKVLSELAGDKGMENTMEKPRIFKVYEGNDKEVVPGALYMRHMFGNDMSIALFKFAQGKGSDAPAEVHSHGEEIGLVLKGTARVFGTDGNEYVIKAGEAIIIPSGWEHSGTFDDDEECLIFTVAFPKRPDYGPEDEAPAPVGFNIAQK
jgi:quercetin dioxygenase-like cupin family protein